MVTAPLYAIACLIARGLHRYDIPPLQLITLHLDIQRRSSLREQITMSRIALTLALVLLWQAASSLGQEQPWQAGVARVKITPTVPIWLSGYAARNKPAQEVHDDLWAKALALHDAGGRQAVLVTLDVIGIDRDFSRDVCRRIEERFNVPRAAIALATSHTHSGPVVGTNLAPMYALDQRQTDSVRNYTGKLADEIVNVVGQSLESLAPARLSWGTGHATFAVNRRNNRETDVAQRRQENALVGPVDHDVPVLAIHDEASTLRAIVCGYACHATVLDDYFVSADWPGVAQRELEQRHPGTTVLYWAGCGGDQNPLPRRSVDWMNQHGRALADAVDATLRTPLKTIPGQLHTTYEEVDLQFAALPTRNELESLAAGEPPKAIWAKYLLANLDRGGSLPTSYPYPIQAWKLGDEMNWLFLGGEVVVDYSLRLKSELGTNTTWVASYANDVMGYIPSRRVLAEGGYEGGESRIYYGLPAVWAENVEQTIVDAAHGIVETD
jgi:hypothetical protein